MSHESPPAPKYPNVVVKLGGADGNAFGVIGLCQKAARAAGVPAAEIKAFTDEAMSGSYDNLIQTCMKWFDVT